MFVDLCRFFVLLICFHAFTCICVSKKHLILNHLKWNWRRIERDNFTGCYQAKYGLVAGEDVLFGLFFWGWGVCLVFFLIQ